MRTVLPAVGGANKCAIGVRAAKNNIARFVANQQFLDSPELI